MQGAFGASSPLKLHVECFEVAVEHSLRRTGYWRLHGSETSLAHLFIFKTTNDLYDFWHSEVFQGLNFKRQYCLCQCNHVKTSVGFIVSPFLNSDLFFDLGSDHSDFKIRTCYFCESWCLFYLSFNSNFYVSKIIHLWARNLPRKPNN